MRERKGREREREKVSICVCERERCGAHWELRSNTTAKLLRGTLGNILLEWNANLCDCDQGPGTAVHIRTPASLSHCPPYPIKSPFYLSGFFPLANIYRNWHVQSRYLQKKKNLHRAT